MPPKSNGNGSAHEARLLRLEDGLSELKASHVEVSTNLKNLGVQVEQSATGIRDKIDSIFKPLAEAFHDHVKEDTLSRDKLNDVGIVVDRLEEERAAKKTRWRAWKAAIVAVMTGAGAIALKELVMYFVNQR